MHKSGEQWLKVGAFSIYDCRIHVSYCDPSFGRALINSLQIATISTALTLILGCMAAYAIWGVIMATGVLLAIPPIIFTFVASR